MVKQMKKKIIYTFILAAFIFSTGGCNDPVFYLISQEIPRIEPLVRGSPTNFAVFKDTMYVASGRTLFRYKNNEWGNTLLSNRIVQLAATDSYLYALFFEERGSIILEIKRTATPEAADSWINILSLTNENFSNSKFQTIYSAGNTLFIGAQISNEDRYIVIQVIGDVITYTNISGNISALLRGAAFDGTNIFLCTEGGIYKNGVLIPVPENSNFNFRGIISLDDNSIAAITRNGNLHRISPDFEPEPVTGFNDGRRATGAMAVWQDTNDPQNRILLVGRQDISLSSSGFTFGYVELILDAAGGISAVDTFRTPGVHQPSTIDDNSIYVSSLGKIPINHIFQTPVNVDGERVLFASTQQDGVWSVRGRPNNSSPHWNAEGGQ